MKNSKLFLTALFVAILLLVIFVVVQNRIFRGSEPAVQILSYCNAAFLDEFKTKTDSEINTDELKRYQECKPIFVYLKNNLTELQIENMLNELRATQGVYRADYISKEDALERYKEQNKDEPLLLESVPADVLPASIDVYVSDPQLRLHVIEFAKSKDVTESVVPSY